MSRHNVIKRRVLFVAVATAFLLAIGLPAAKAQDATPAASPNPFYFESLYSFSSGNATGAYGINPGGDKVVFDSAGNVYGTAAYGVNSLSSVIWDLTASGTYNDLYNFVDEGAGPLMFDSAGNLLGVADSISDPFYDVLWKIAPSGAYQVLHQFVATSDGVGPEGVVEDEFGNMYGAAFNGGIYAASNNDFGGMVWELTSGGAYKHLHDFGGQVVLPDGTQGADGYFPTHNLTIDSQGNLYGVAGGGAEAYGLIWEITNSGSYKVLHEFYPGSVPRLNGSTGPDGLVPYGGVTVDNSGNLFGTTNQGGDFGEGAIWEYTTSGTYEIVHDFGGSIVNANGATGSDGVNPVGAAVFDASGNMYGTTFRGGGFKGTAAADCSNGCGMIWEITTTGVYKDLYDFSYGEVWSPSGSSVVYGFDGVYTNVAIGPDGNMYGTTYAGGSVGLGTLWKLTLPPTAPTDLTGSAGVQMALFSWNAVPGATSYNYYKSYTSGTETLAYTGITQTNWRNITQTPGKTIYYQVTAVNASGESARSNEIAVTPLPLPAPTVTAAAGNGVITLSWTPVTATGESVTYSIFRGISSGGESATPIATGLTGLYYADTNVTNGTAYYYTVQAVDSVSSSAQSTQVVATPSSAAPLAPANLTGSAGVQAAFFSWTASAGATSYNYYKSYTSGTETLAETGITQTNWRNITQKPGTTLYYQVTAVNASGESARSNEIAITPQALPAPSPVVATSGVGQVTLSWGAVGSLGTTTTYSVFRGTTSGGESEAPIASGLSATSYTDTSVTNGTTCYYTVRAVNLVSSSVQSNEVSAEPQQISVP